METTITTMPIVFFGAFLFIGNLSIAGLFIFLSKLVAERFSDKEGAIFFILFALFIIFASFNYFITNLIFSIPH